MHPTHTDNETDQDAQPLSRGRSRLIVLFTLLLIFVLIAVLPPLVNVSRFQKRIASNISAALGRPVHFDSVSLTLIPLPGFTLKTFVIDEDPAFGYEPILRADQVQVTLRISSLWHPHVEFSKIAFTEPSVNLVHAANGKWNVESLLLQASHLQAAPTGQRFAGPARRFPYIEATGARLNLKLDQEKTPISLTDTDFALWLPEPHQWHLRLEAHPMRTDTDTADTGAGTIRAEGTLGGADLNASSLAQVPIDLQGDWRDAQLGSLSRLLLGRDPGLRGDFSLSFAILGTIGHNTVTTGIKVTKARRADFVPNHLLSLEAACKAIAGGTFHSFTSIQCQGPPAESSAFSNSPAPTLLALTASVPSVSDPRSASATLTLPALPADTLFDWLSVATPHPPTVLEGAGSLTGTLNWGVLTATNQPPAEESSSTQPALYGQLELSGTSIATNPDSNRSIPLGDVLLRSTPSPAAPPARSRHSRTPLALPPVPNSFDLLPVMIPLGGKQPATLEGHFDSSGYSFHLTGNVLYARLLELAKAVPQLGDGLNPFLAKIAAGNPDADPNPTPADATAASPEIPTAPIHIDFTATRAWGGPQIWTENSPPAPTHSSR